MEEVEDTENVSQSSNEEINGETNVDIDGERNDNNNNNSAEEGGEEGYGDERIESNKEEDRSMEELFPDLSSPSSDEREEGTNGIGDSNSNSNNSSESIDNKMNTEENGEKTDNGNGGESGNSNDSGNNSGSGSGEGGGFESLFEETQKILNEGLAKYDIKNTDIETREYKALCEFGLSTQKEIANRFVKENLKTIKNKSAFLHSIISKTRDIEKRARDREEHKKNTASNFPIPKLPPPKRSAPTEVDPNGGLKLLDNELKEMLEKSLTKVGLDINSIDPCIFESIVTFPMYMQQEMIRLLSQENLTRVRNLAGYIVGMLVKYRKRFLIGQKGDKHSRSPRRRSPRPRSPRHRSPRPRSPRPRSPRPRSPRPRSPRPRSPRARSPPRHRRSRSRDREAYRSRDRGGRSPPYSSSSRYGSPYRDRRRSGSRGRRESPSRHYHRSSPTRYRSPPSRSSYDYPLSSSSSSSASSSSSSSSSSNRRSPSRRSPRRSPPRRFSPSRREPSPRHYEERPAGPSFQVSFSEPHNRPYVLADPHSSSSSYRGSLPLLGSSVISLPQPAPDALRQSWYFADRNQGVKHGPFPVEEMKREWDRGLMNPSWLVWYSGMETWQELRTLPVLLNYLMGGGAVAHKIGPVR